MVVLSFEQTFLVRTDQQSLKYLHDHKVGIPMQQKWIIKLLDYKKGTENRVADALSRRQNEDECLVSLTAFPIISWMDDLMAACG